MATFKDFFQLQTGADQYSQALYDVIKDATTADECYKLLFEQCILVLKKCSIKFRREKMKDSETLPDINPNLERSILSQLPETLTDTNSADITLYEGAEVNKTTITQGEPRVYFTFTTNPPAINDTYKRVQTYLKRQGVNELIQLYKPKSKPGQNFPDLVATNDNNTINTAIDELTTWIKFFIPPVKKVYTLQPAPSWKQVLDFLFTLTLEDSPKSDEYRLKAINIFRKRWKTKINDKQQRQQRKDFIQYLQGGMLTNADPPEPWNFSNDLKDKYKLLKYYVSLGDKDILVKEQGRLPKDQAVIVTLTDLWLSALALGTYKNEQPTDAQTRRTEVAAKVYEILKNFSPVASDSYYDTVISQNIFLDLKESLDQEYSIEQLEILKQKGNADPPNHLAEETIIALKDAIDELLKSIDLEYKGQFKPVPGGGSSTGCNAQISPFDSYWKFPENSDAVSLKNVYDNSAVSYISVDGDPKEIDNSDFVARYRPICHYETNNQRLGVFNLWPTLWNGDRVQNGTFFFEDKTDPRLVVTKVASSGTFGKTQYNVGTPLTISFSAGTINGAKQDASGTSFVERTPQGGITRRYFFEVLNAITQWKDSLRGNLTFLPYYHTVLNQVNSPISHLRRDMPQGRGQGIGRADEVQDAYALWYWDAPKEKRDTYGKLPKILGLPENRQIVVKSGTYPDAFKASIDGKDCDCNLSIESFSNSPFKYGLLTATPQDSADPEYYVLVNTPSDITSVIEKEKSAVDAGSNRSAKRGVASTTTEVLALFRFDYFRKVDGDQWKVLKSVPAESTRRPNTNDGIIIQQAGQPNDPTVIGINLPISFRLEDNVQLLDQSKMERRDIKNKASVLYKAQGQRTDAGTVMAGIYNSISSQFQQLLSQTTSQSKLSATVFTTLAIKQADTTRNDWQALKNTDRTTLTVDQEWCHLQGHGDGGTERLGNFVSGSYHCNTEQLAMEEGLRITTQNSPKDSYFLRTTAYLLKDDNTVMSQNYLASDGVYTKLLEKNKGIVAVQMGAAPTAATQSADDAQEPPQKKPRPNPVLPIAAFIRYKIVQQSSANAYQKVWDYIFEGQSEFFDRNQYMILNKTIEFALAGSDAFNAWYTEAAAALADAAANNTSSSTSS
jgi:hypothetical protein